MIYFRNQVTPFVILFIERDGSTYLTSMLMSHPDILADYEKFAVLRQEGANGEEQLAWVRSFFTAPLVGKKAAVGFKTKLVDVLDRGGFVDFLQEKRVQIVQMQRRNRVKAVVSRINARRLYEATGYWNLYKESDRLQAIDIKFELFDQYLNEREQADEELIDFVQRLQLPTHKVLYEDLLQNKDGVIGQLLSFLNVRSVPLEGKPLKSTKDNLREVILNYDDLRAKYVGTQYESMFDEVITE